MRSRESSPAPWKPSINGSRESSPAPRHSSGGCFSTGTLIPVEPSFPLPPTHRTRVAVELLREGDRISTRHILGTQHLGGNALSVPLWTSIHSVWKTSCPLLRPCFAVEGGYVTTDHPLFHPGRAASGSQTWTLTSHAGLYPGLGEEREETFYFIVLSVPSVIWVDGWWMAAGGAHLPHSFRGPPHPGDLPFQDWESHIFGLY